MQSNITLHNNKVKIIAQLIDANDNHVWSKEYDDSFTISSQLVSLNKTDITYFV